MAGQDGHDELEALERAVAAVQAGDREAFRDVIVACELRVRLIVAAILPDHEAVEDIAQEAFLKAYEKLGEYQPGTDFHAWLGTLTRHLALNERKRQLRRFALQQRVRSVLDSSCDSETELAVAAMKAEALAALRDCREELGATPRKIVDAFYFEGRSSVELAQAVRREESWVRLVLFRARRALSDCLRRKGALGHG